MTWLCSRVISEKGMRVVMELGSAASAADMSEAAADAAETASCSKKTPITTECGTSMLTPSCRSFEYAEMNLRHSGSAERTTALVKRAVRMGYDSVVINIDIGDLFQSGTDPDEDAELQPPPSKKAKKKGKGQGRASEAAPIPDPFLVDESALQLTALTSAGKRFRQYSRLTVTLADTSYVHQFFHSPQLKKFDLVAIRPDNEQIFTTLTRKTEFFDIITFDQTASKVHWLHGGGKSKQVQQLADEGVGFEMCYGEGLTDSSVRRQVLANGRSLLQTTKGKKVYVASGATDIMDLRAPVDTMNMMVLYGVKAGRARPHISDFPREILLRAEAKKTLKGAIAVTSKEQIPSKTVSQQAALARLLAVPEFFIQIEEVPPKAAVKKEDTEEKMDESGPV